MSAPVDYPTLYSLTGDVKDINTLLVPASQLEAIGAGGVSAPVALDDAQPVAVQRVPLMVDDLWKNDALMALNAEIGLPIQHLEEIVAVIEAAHGIKPTSREGGAAC